MVNTTGPSDINAGLDYLAAHPEWMVFLCIAVPFLVMMTIGAFMDRTKTPTRTKADTFDFDKITSYHNEIGNDRKEQVS